MLATNNLGHPLQSEGASMARIDDLQKRLDQLGRVNVVAVAQATAIILTFRSLLTALHESGALSRSDLGSIFDRAIGQITAVDHPMMTPDTRETATNQIIAIRRSLGF
jgi:hypothetical protein